MDNKVLHTATCLLRGAGGMLHCYGQGAVMGGVPVVPGVAIVVVEHVGSDALGHVVQERQVRGVELRHGLRGLGQRYDAAGPDEERQLPQADVDIVMPASRSSVS